MERKCIIELTPDNKEMQANIQTGGVSTLEIMDAFKTLLTGFSKKLCSEYQEYSGKSVNEDPEGFDEWIQFLRREKI
jgi:hypothetical protein